MPTTTDALWQQTVGLIQSQGAVSGLSPDQINAAIAIAAAEGGWNGTVGDNGTSFGIFQFHLGGALDSFAAWLRSSTSAAIAATTQRPDWAVQFALGTGGYLWQALRDGAAKGYSGPALAAYAEQYGQKSAAPGWQDAADWYTKLFGGAAIQVNPPATTTPVAIQPTDATTTTQPTVQLPAKSDLPVIGPGIDAINYVGASIQAAVLSLERFFWIVIGLMLSIVGIWVLVKERDRGS